MKTLIFLLFTIFSFLSINLPQNLKKVMEFPANGVKIYSLKFIDSKNGWAESFLGNVLITSDGGKSWNESREYNFAKDENKWSIDIFCAISISADGGNTWVEYPKKQQEHFCSVYFKDENTGWKVAEEFLISVIDTIRLVKEKGETELKIGLVFKCREYYTDENEGWSLGWCYRNLKEN